MLDLHTAMSSRADWKSLLSDGLHPNAEGGKVIGTAVLGAIASHFPELKPASFADPRPCQAALGLSGSQIDRHWGPGGELRCARRAEAEVISWCWLLPVHALHGARRARWALRGGADAPIDARAVWAGHLARGPDDIDKFTLHVQSR